MPYRLQSGASPQFDSFRLSNILIGAVVGTQALATIIAVYGLIIPPIGWRLAIFIWIYALIGWVVIYQLKARLYYGRLDLWLKGEADKRKLAMQAYAAK